MIFVTVGTHEAPFDRLVAAAELVARGGDEEVVVQRGYSLEPAPHCTVHELLSPREVEVLVERARVVITHAGPASILLALAKGRVPIVVPRDPAWAEHVDDHQLAFARRIGDRVHVVRDPGRLVAEIAAHPQVEAQLRASAPDDVRSESFARRLGALVDALVREAAPRRGLLRATVAVFAGVGGSRR